MEKSSYALVLTGDVLPGYTAEAVWPRLAAYFRMEPARLNAQLLARAPLTIKQSDDLGKLQTLQGGAAAVGAATELCAPDDRANLFVVLDNAPRGPVPRVFVDERIEHGLWPNDLMVAAVGEDAWKPYREFDAAAVAASAPPIAEPAPEPEHMFDALAAQTQSMPLKLMPIESAVGGNGFSAPLPPGNAIHAGFWRRSAALIIDSFLLGIATAIFQFVLSMTVLGGAASGALNMAAVLGSTFLLIVLAFVGQWLYFALFESGSMQATPGKRAMGLKVVDLTGQRIGFGRASGRYFGKIISTIIFDIGYMLAGWTERKQALHDMLASTLVVFRNVEPGQPMPAQRPPMPWYGWLLNILLVALFPLAILAAIALPAYQQYAARANVANALVSADGIKTAVSEYYAQNQRCPASLAEAGIDAPVSPMIGNIEVQPNCSIVITFKGSDALPAQVRARRIELAGKPMTGGTLAWTCSSTLASSYLPASCRD